MELLLTDVCFKCSAPGRWLGYGATPLPGVTEALTIDKCPRKVIKEVNRLAQAIYRTASSLKL